MSDINTDFWELLNLTEDLLRGGTRREHGAAPEARAVGDSTARTRGLASVAAEVAAEAMEH